MTTVSEMGEDALIMLFAPGLPTSDSTIIGPGDDAAVLALDGDLVVSSDVLVENRHFRRDWSSGADVGWRAAVQNLADIDAMGAVPIALQVTLAMPGDLEVDWVIDFVDGLRQACEPHGVGVVGGDLSSSREIHIGVTALGETHGVHPVKRSDAEPGDLIAVSGSLGAAAAGLAQLQADTVVNADAISLFTRPRPQIGVGLEAALRGAHAMMDISDGLMRDASRMARASELGFAIDSSLVPVDPTARDTAQLMGLEALPFALIGGEDHRLLATFPSRAAVPPHWVVIGEVSDDWRGLRVDGKVPEQLGWDHFEQ